jgi:tetratricopeptide (TPR) repeat protein
LLVANLWRLWSDLRPVPELRVAQGLIDGRKDREAETALREILDRSPDHGQARLMLAKLLGKRNDQLGCARELGRIPYWWPGKREAGFYEGEAYRQCDMLRTAERAFRSCTTDDPLRPIAPKLLIEASSQLIEIYAFEERWDDAVEVVWNAFGQSTPAEQPTILGMRIRLMLERMAPESVAPRMRAILTVDDGDIDARRALARAELALRHDEEADREIARCLQAEPGNFLVWRDWVRMLEIRGDNTAMAAALDRLPRKRQVCKDAEFWEYLGLARQAKGDLAGAAEALRRAVELKPYSPTSVYRLATVEQRMGEVKLAAEHRKRSTVIRESLDKLTNAYLDYMDLMDAKSSTTTERRNAGAKVAELFEKLGMAREAKVWKEIAARS